MILTTTIQPGQSIGYISIKALVLLSIVSMSAAGTVRIAASDDHVPLLPHLVFPLAGTLVPKVAIGRDAVAIIELLEPHTQPVIVEILVDD